MSKICEKLKFKKNIKEYCHKCKKNEWRIDHCESEDMYINIKTCLNCGYSIEIDREEKNKII